MVSSIPSTLLFLACCFDLTSIVERLSTLKNIDWNQRNNRGNSGLVLAAERGHEAVVRLLLEERADVAAKANYGWTALHVTAAEGYEAVVRVRACGPSVTSTFATFSTALWHPLV